MCVCVSVCILHSNGGVAEEAHKQQQYHHRRHVLATRSDRRHALAYFTGRFRNPDGALRVCMFVCACVYLLAKAQTDPRNAHLTHALELTVYIYRHLFAYVNGVCFN